MAAQKSVQNMLDNMQARADAQKSDLDEQYEGHLSWLRKSVRENKKRLFPGAADAEEERGTAKRVALKVRK
jgi:hypothetical protein